MTDFEGIFKYALRESLVSFSSAWAFVWSMTVDSLNNGVLESLAFFLGETNTLFERETRLPLQ